MLTIDVHTHILPKELPDWKSLLGYGGFIQLDHHKPCCARMIKDDGTFFREIDDNCWDAEVRMKECNATRVNVQVLSTVPVMFNYWTKPDHGYDIARFLNDHLAGIVTLHPKRFVGLGTVPMQDTRLAIYELERCMKMGLRGVEIGTNINGKNLDDPMFTDFFHAAEDLNAAIFVHPWDMLGGDRLQNYWLPWLVGMPTELAIAISTMIFGGVFTRFPKLKMLFAHGGGSFPAILGRLQHGFDSRPDLVAVKNKIPPMDYVDKFYVDSLVHDPKALRHLISVFGEKRIALGSDYPFPLGEAEPGKLIRDIAGLSESSQKRMLSGTALERLGLSEGDFK
jgi:aminocarboxymuconate-semialdehyde decarboxylase